MGFLIRWLVATLAILIAAYIIPNIEIENLFAAFVAALILGIINAVIKPILIILTLPINIVTLGLFTLVINAGLVLLVSAIVPGFVVIGFWWAMLFSILLSVITFALSQITK